MAKVARSLDMMRRRADFVAATKAGVKVGGPLISLQLRDRAAPDQRPRVGFTATKRIGGAVERNRMKRRLRAAAGEALAGEARAGCDYVLVARRAVLDAGFDRLLRDLSEQLRRAHGKADGGRDAGRAERRRESGR
ncbi:ribonuclease P protein component [Hansschlegelia zhihuaiae]|uniref:Ribonuclease P protein component n=1 Tax=Hansschlegelia zhihuaiae TaxID=405005 RepID=A0A4Q0MBW2_9HYPH|nr:ribonuclease P protein component [Hansschlegelia zhihuaiae]RXF70256.1 ribonuclease P protein component [Hansschlegelia zhihuaiae]